MVLSSLMKESTRRIWKAEDPRRCGRLDVVCIRYRIHSQGSLLSLHLCHTQNWHWALKQAKGFALLPAGWELGLECFHTVLQTRGTQYSSAHLHCALAVSTSFFYGCWSQNYSYCSIRLFEKALGTMVELL